MIFSPSSGRNSWQNECVEMRFSDALFSVSERYFLCGLFVPAVCPCPFCAVWVNWALWINSPWENFDEHFFFFYCPCGINLRW